MEAGISEYSKSNYLSGTAGGLSFTIDDNQTIYYSVILDELSVTFTTKSPFLQVGPGKPENDWIFYISIIRQQATALLTCLVPELIKLNLDFSIPENSAILTQILDGSFGAEEVGKVITIYSKKDTDLTLVAQRLIYLSQTFKSPTVPYAFFLGGCVYTNTILPFDRRINWPFDSITGPIQIKELKKIKSYLLVHILKGDAKGNVYKTLNLKNWLNINWCVLKKGNQNQCTDDFGRTIEDRLRWQYMLLMRFSDLIPLPKPIEYFSYKSDSYLVIEYLNGQNLYDKVSGIQHGLTWIAMETDAKREVIKLIFEVIKIIELFHAYGIIHRDINPGNFIVCEDNHVKAIDIELAYDLTAQLPSPAFSYGTPGYVSLQQQQLQPPVISDDIFGLAALIIRIMTGTSPGKFRCNEPEDTFHRLFFFIGNNNLATLLSACLNDDPDLRPTLNSLTHGFEVYEALLLTNHLRNNCKQTQILNIKIDELIQRGLNQFSFSVLQDLNGLWISKAHSESIIANENKKHAVNSGFANGIAGILYVVALSETQLFDVVHLQDIIWVNYNYLIHSYSNLSHQIFGQGLFYGKIGLGISINEMIKVNLLENNISNHQIIYDCLNGPTAGVNIATGIAGQGISFLVCSNYSKLPSFYEELNAIVKRLLDEQNTDGSWWIYKDAKQRKGIKLLGFCSGISGILYFLIQYFISYPEQRIETAIKKGLKFLLKKQTWHNGHLVWPISEINENIDPWFEHGFTGIALTFILAYKIWLDPEYKDAVTEALQSHPKFIASNLLTVGNGLAGLGEIYLEAFKAFHESEWLERANHIVNILASTYNSNLCGIHWVDGNSSVPVADFMDGNIGIIHFFLHYHSPEKLSFPFNLD
jgi:serine/threonine protein kinase